MTHSSVNGGKGSVLLLGVVVVFERASECHKFKDIATRVCFVLQFPLGRTGMSLFLAMVEHIDYSRRRGRECK